MIHERHRHRYEVSMPVARRLEEKGLIISGVSPDGLLPEIVELKDHPFLSPYSFTPNLNPVLLNRTPFSKDLLPRR